MMRTTMRRILLCLLPLTAVKAFYVSYEKPNDYAKGDRVPLFANKLTSSNALISVDYKHLPPCNSESFGPIETGNNRWQASMNALHGDAIRPTLTYELRLGHDVHCGQLCVLDLEMDQNRIKWQAAIEQDLHYNWILDGLPTAFRYENQDRVAIRYWGGLPVGRRGYYDDVERGEYEDDERYENTTADDLFLYNHVNFEILYSKSPHDASKYRILRTTLQPFSIQHDMVGLSNWPIPLRNPIASCNPANDDDAANKKQRTNYAELEHVPPQPATGHVLITYGVTWMEYHYQGGGDPFKTRWNVFLRMDDGIPMIVQSLGLILALFLNLVVFGVLTTWVLRDLSYKPLVMECDDDLATQEQLRQAQLWPLNTRVFFAPQYPFCISVACGTGAQLGLAGGLFVIFFRIGIINESLGASIVTPAIVLYLLASPAGGYITARLYRICRHAGSLRMALVASGIQAVAYPLLGILVVFPLVYDVLSYPAAPTSHVLQSSWPVILLWLFVMIPLTVGGGYFGYRHGPLHNFPVSERSTGYQDMTLPNNDDDDEDDEQKKPVWWRRYLCCRSSCWGIWIASILPVLGSFVEYAYGVAGPVYIGYFSDSSAFAILSFALFCTCVGGVAVLLYYRQLRAQDNAAASWWWKAFWTGCCSGFYLFLLSISWILINVSQERRNIPGSSMTSYTLWFAYGSLGAGLVAAFCSVAACIFFTRILYATLMRRYEGYYDTSVGIPSTAGDDDEQQQGKNSGSGSSSSGSDDDTTSHRHSSSLLQLEIDNEFANAEEANDDDDEDCGELPPAQVSITTTPGDRRVHVRSSSSWTGRIATRFAAGGEQR